MKEKDLTPAAQKFLNELRSQMPGDIEILFNDVVLSLEKLSPVDEMQIRKLNALEAAGVDNWIGYDDAMSKLEEYEEEEYEEEEYEEEDD